MEAFLHLCHAKADIFAVTPSVSESPTYVAAHMAMIDFLNHVVRYVEAHGDELKLFGISLRFVYIKVVLGVAGTQFVTLLLTAIRSLAA